MNVMRYFGGIEMIMAVGGMLQAAELNISVWTVNDVTRAKQLRDWGIQGMITDYPKLMLQQLLQLLLWAV